MRRARVLGIALIAGVAAGLGHAPFGLWPVALIGFAVLIHLVAHAVRPAFMAWAGGLGYFALTLNWIVEPFLVNAAQHGWMAPFALVLMAGGLALFWGLAGYLSHKLAHRIGARALAFVTLLAAAEMLRGHIFTGFPWALPAYIWAETPLRIVTAWTGSYGLTFLTLVALALPTISVRSLGAIVAVGLLGGLAALGQLSVDETAVKTPLGTVRLVQPNVPQTEKWDPAKVPAHIERMLSLTRGDGSDVDLVVWPEVAIAYPLDRAETVLRAAAQSANEGAGQGKVLTGINRRDGESWFNSLALIGNDGIVEETYDKVHLVPFGEYIPFRLKFIQAMAATSGFGFSAGEAVRLVDTPLGRALPLICYEGIFPGHVFRAGERPDYMLQITNDAWFGEFSGPFQHLDQARFRAAEQGLPMVRVANTGISTVIDPYGRSSADNELPLGSQGFQDVLVKGKSGITFYARFGDFPAIFGIFLTLCVLLMRERSNSIANRPTTS